MILRREGGTGKSKVIQTITQGFVHRNASFMLLKSAYTSIAALLIDGKTTHCTIGMVSRNGHSLSNETKAKLQTFWKHYVYLIIDECSMISKTFLAELSRNIPGIGKARGAVENPDSRCQPCHGFSGIWGYQCNPVWRPSSISSGCWCKEGLTLLFFTIYRFRGFEDRPDDIRRVLDSCTVARTGPRDRYCMAKLSSLSLERSS